jgi:endonuclease-3
MSEEKPHPPQNAAAAPVAVSAPSVRRKPGKTTAAKAKKPAKKAAKKPAKASRLKTADAKTRVMRTSLYSPDEVRALFERFRAANPAPKGELLHTNAFTLVVAVVLSAQATDVGVNKATRELFRLADTPQKMLALGEYRIGELIKTIGLFRTKAKNVLALSQRLIDEFGGEVPANRDDLIRLAGVGPKTANVVLNTAFGEPTIAVDTHIFRLANRLELAPGRSTPVVERALTTIIPDEFKRDAHHWLILHGRYVCKARVPDCSHCIIADLCKYPDKTSDVAFVPEAK